MGQHHVKDPAWRRRNRERWEEMKRLAPKSRWIKRMPASPKRLWKMLIQSVGSKKGAREQRRDEQSKAGKTQRHRPHEAAS